MISYKNYVLINGWSALDSRIGSLSELVIYSIIYGFCQLDNSVSIPTSYISEWTRLSKWTVLRRVKSLEEKGMISVERQSGDTSIYSIPQEDVTKTARASVRSSLSGDVERAKKKTVLAMNKDGKTFERVCIATIVKDTITDEESKIKGEISSIGAMPTPDNSDVLNLVSVKKNDPNFYAVKVGKDK